MPRAGGVLAQNIHELQMIKAARTAEIMYDYTLSQLHEEDLFDLHQDITAKAEELIEAWQTGP